MLISAEMAAILKSEMPDRYTCKQRTFRLASGLERNKDDATQITSWKRLLQVVEVQFNRTRAFKHLNINSHQPPHHATELHLRTELTD
jgi:hypothetical protein